MTRYRPSASSRPVLMVLVALFLIHPATLIHAVLQDALTIVVIEGEDGVNIIQQKTAVRPIVEVRDRNNLPVSGAIVTFAIGGRNATFAGGAQSLTVTTDASGRAVAATLDPVRAGRYRIAVRAQANGQTATTSIAQTNFMTSALAAQAAQTAASGGAGAGAGAGAAAAGGLSTLAIVGIAGGAAAGLGTALAVSGGDSTPAPPPAPANNAPSITSVTATPNAIILGAGLVAFSAQATDRDNDAITYTWNFGDSGTGTGAAQTHTYQATGTFNVTLTVSDGKTSTTSQTTVNVRSLTGRWAGLGGGIATLTQTGSTVAGTTAGGDVPGVGFIPGFNITGTIRTTAPQVSITETQTVSYTSGNVIGTQTVVYTWMLTPSTDANSLAGSYVVAITYGGALAGRVPNTTFGGTSTAARQ